MLNGRAKANSSSCSQTVIIFSHFVAVYSWNVRELQPKVAKINFKTLILEVQGLSKSSILIRLKSSSLVFIVIGSMSMPICNCFHERLVNNGKNNDFFGCTAFWCPCAQVSLSLENRDLDRRNLRSMLKTSYAASSFLSQLISAQFTLEMCLAARNRQKN